jgi:hypothetical protein
MEGPHANGEILPKISVNFVFSLCDVLLFMHFILWVFSYIYILVTFL